MNWQEFIALLVLSTAATFTPGPNTTLSTALAANFGLKRAMTFVLSVPIGWGLLFTLCAAGLGTLVVQVPLLRQVITWGGLHVFALAGLQAQPQPNSDATRQHQAERDFLARRDAAIFKHQGLVFGGDGGGGLDGRSA